MSLKETKFISRAFPISSLCRKITEGELDLSPPWQRNVVWTIEMQRKLVMTVLKGFPINPIVIWTFDGKELCVDGKNRLTAIQNFMNNMFTVYWDGSDIKYNDLSQKAKNDFNDENLDIRILTGLYWNETKVREYFQVIQGGSKLTWPEIINSFNNKFVDFMREIMLNNQDRFVKLLGTECNNRFELYNVIANVFSVHPLVYSQYNTKKTKLRTADTNKSLMTYVMNFEDFEIDDSGSKELTEFLHKTIYVLEALHSMQQKEIASYSKSIWYLTETDSSSVRNKPGIRDFTSVAYYITLNPTIDLDVIICDIKTVFKVFVQTTLDSSKSHDIKSLIHDYYITYGKNQKQYAWTSVSERYKIMLQVLKQKDKPLIVL